MKGEKFFFFLLSKSKIRIKLFPESKAAIRFNFGAKENPENSPKSSVRLRGIRETNSGIPVPTFPRKFMSIFGTKNKI